MEVERGQRSGLESVCGSVDETRVAILSRWLVLAQHLFEVCSSGVELFDNS